MRTDVEELEVIETDLRDLNHHTILVIGILRQIADLLTEIRCEMKKVNQQQEDQQVSEIDLE